MATQVARIPTPETIIERRSGDRQVTTYRAARIVAPAGQEQLGIVRNVSVGGVMIETHAFLAVGDRLCIEPRGCEPVAGRVVWSKGLRHGVAFDERIAEESLAKFVTNEVRGQIARAPRISFDMDARLCVQGGWSDVRLRDLSQGGAKIDHSAVLVEADPVVLGVDGLGSIAAFVRWQRDGKVGLLFAKPLSITTLSAWIAGITPDPEPLGPIQDYI